MITIDNLKVVLGEQRGRRSLATLMLWQSHACALIRLDVRDATVVKKRVKGMNLIEAFRCVLDVGGAINECAEEYS